MKKSLNNFFFTVTERVQLHSASFYRGWAKVSWVSKVFSRGRGSNCVFLRLPIALEFFHGGPCPPPS